MVIAAILAGGYGKRLRPITETIPKPLIEVAGKPILEHQIEWLRNHGVTNIVLLVGYQKEKIIEEIGSGNRLGIRATYVIEEEPRGTAGAIKNAEHILKSEELFLVLNGDIITNLDPEPLMNKVREKDTYAALAAVPLRSPYGILDIEGDLIRKFIEKPYIPDYWINGGVYVMTPKVFDYIPEKGDVERHGFPELAQEGKLSTVKYQGIFWKSIDTHKDIEEATKELSKLK
ncbi:MAG: nucleotidyltransferase family protein [Desulfurococcales archaeon]|nr:nucleotidyltransferase family protein [Desulfurococcales archaeon]